MSKLKKSIKSILISIFALVILAGSVFGVLLANHKDEKNVSNDVEDILVAEQELTQDDSISFDSNDIETCEHQTHEEDEVDLYATTYTITFDLKNGHTRSDMTVSVGQTFKVSKIIAKAGNDFSGWAITGMCTDCVHYWGGSARGMSSTSMGVTDDSGFMNLHHEQGAIVKFTALWSPRVYSIAYDFNGGKKGSGTYTNATSYGSKFNVPSPTRLGYTFNGWTISGLSTAYCYWDGIQNASVSTNGVATGVKSTTGYQNLSAAKSGKVTFTATWTPNSYSISYNLNSGSAGSYAPSSANYDSTITISNPSRVGYTFTGWTIGNMSTDCTHYFGGSDKGKNASASNVKDTSFKNLRSTAGTVTFTANWSPITYSINYSLGTNGVSGSNAPTSANYDSLFNVSHPTRLGYTFSSWTISSMSNNCTHYWGGQARGTDTSASNVIATTDFKNLRSSSSDAVIFTAQWIPITYSIEYELNGGISGTDAPISVSYSETFSVSYPVKTGYTFASWNISNMCTNCAHNYGENSTTNSSIDNVTSTYFKNLRASSGTVKFTANWTANTYTVVFDMNNPNSVTNDISSWSNETMTYDISKTLTGVPTKTGYTFACWNISGMDQISSVTGDTIVHKHRINNDETWSEFTGSTLNAISLPHQFMNLRSTAGTVTFTAQWTPIYYNLSYDANTGNFNSDTNNPSKVSYDETFYVTTPIKHGYNFTGWSIYVDDVPSTTYSISALYPNTSTDSFKNCATTNSSNVKFVANYLPVTYTITFNYNNPTKANDSTIVTFDSWKFISNPTRMGYLFDYWEISGASDCGHQINCSCFANVDEGRCSHYYNITDSDSEAIRFTGTSIARSTYQYFKNLHCSNDGNVMFIAHWLKKTYRVVNAGVLYGATISTEFPQYDNVFTMTAPTSAPVGFHFNGWEISGANNKDENTNEIVEHFYGSTSSPLIEFTGTSVTVEKTIMYFKNLSSDSWRDDGSSYGTVTITPVWEENTYTVSFNMNSPNRITDDITSISNITATYNSTFNVAFPLKAGYSFIGWTLSGLSTDCDHYYGDSSSSMTAFKADPSGAYKDSETAQYVLLKNTYFMNLRSSSGIAILKANWKPLKYTITYHYIPASFNVANYNSTQLFTHINIPQNMTKTITFEVEYDSRYEALAYKNELDEVQFELPVGLRFKLWAISDSSLSGTLSIAKYDENDVVVTTLSDSILPNESRIYGPGKASDGALTWQYYAQNIHLYACYDLAGINLRYYAPENASGENNLSTYKNLPSANTSVKYTELITFAGSSFVVDGVNLMGWMISADYFSSGELTEQSITVFDYQGTNYVSYQGAEAYWSYTNVDAYSFEDPTYFLYAIYSDEYSGCFGDLNFTYVDNSSASYGNHFSSEFYSVNGIRLMNNVLKIPKYYNDGVHGFLPVELIESSAFEGQDISQLIWFNSIKVVGSNAFKDCDKLLNVVFNEGLYKISEQAFYNCKSIVSLNMPSTLKVIDTAAFKLCKNVETIELNEGLLTINESAFEFLTPTEISQGETTKVTSLELPSTLVGEIGKRAFIYLNHDSMIIPKGIIKIGYDCFSECKNLSEVIFEEGSSLKIIDGGSFSQTNIIAVDIPNSVVSIGDWAFYQCSNLEYINLPDSLQFLGNYVFQNCQNLNGITLPKQLSSIPMYAFDGCEKLSSVAIYNGITSINEYAFSNCASLTSIIVPNSVVAINLSAFYGCSKLESIKLPFVGKTASTTTASEYIFGYIFGATSTTQASYVPTTLKTVHITNATKVDVSAFNGLTMLTHLYINKGVTSIGQNAFNGCTSLVELSVPFLGTAKTDTTNNYLGYFFGQTSKNTTSSVPAALKTVHLTNSTSVGAYAFYRTSISSVSLNDGITSIGEYAFYKSKLTEIVMPKTLLTIGNSAFYEIETLVDVTLNEGLTSIGNNAFSVTRIQTIVVPSTVVSIGNNAFNLTHLSSVILFNGVETIGSGAFKETPLQSIVIPSSVTVISDNCFEYCTELTSVTLHDGINSIGEYAFATCYLLSSIEFFDGLESIGDSAFSGCRSLINVYIPDSVISIGECAFTGCQSLSKIRLSNNLTDILYETFKGTAITRIEIPSSVMFVYDSAFGSCVSLETIVCHGSIAYFELDRDGTTPFSNCPNLSYFYYGDNYKQLYEGPYDRTYDIQDLSPLSKPEEVYSFEHMIFTYHYNNGDPYYSFKSKGDINYYDDMVIPETYDDGIHGRYRVEVIEENAFYNQTNLNKVSLPTGIRHINKSAFELCTGLTTINIPASVKLIGSRAFYNCNSLTSTLSIPNDVNRIEDQTFYNCNKANVTFTSSSNLKFIGDEAFYNLAFKVHPNEVIYMTIPSGVTYIGYKAFSYANCFSGVLNLPSGLEYLGEYAFANVTLISEVELPNSLKFLNVGIFKDCVNLREVYIPSSIESIMAPSYAYAPFSGTYSISFSIYMQGYNIPVGWGSYWRYYTSTKQANLYQGYSGLPLSASPLDDKEFKDMNVIENYNLDVFSDIYLIESSAFDIVENNIIYFKQDESTEDDFVKKVS